MARKDGNTILLQADPEVRYDEATLGEAASPGHIVSVQSDGTIKKFKGIGTNPGGIRVLREDGISGKLITDAYASGDPGQFFKLRSGDRFLGRVPANAPAITQGDNCILVGGGVFLKSGGIGGSLYTNVAASAVITNTVAETAFDKSFTLPANSLVAGQEIDIDTSMNIPSTNATDTLTVKLKIGSTIIATTAALDVANGDVVRIQAKLVIRTDGVSGTLVASGSQIIGPPASATEKPFTLASTTVDTTASQLISVTAQWSVANAGNQVRLDTLVIDAPGSGSNMTICQALESVDNSAVAAEGFIGLEVA